MARRTVFDEQTLFKGFFGSCLSCVSRRSWVLAIVNCVYFGCIFVATVLGQFLYRQLPYTGEPFGVGEFFLGLDWPLMILSVFLFNLGLSGFVLVTLPGLVFFPLSVVALGVRAAFWGLMLNQLPTPLFLVAFPTLILEGEGYVLAAICGTNLGLSWFRPGWVYKNKGFSRLEALETASKDCVRIYFFVTLFLFVAAVVEVVTIVSIAS